MKTMITSKIIRSLLLAAAAALVAQPFEKVAAGSVGPGTVTAWGYNGQGCLGDSTTISRDNPVSVLLPPGVLATGIASGQFHGIALTSDGLYQWGDGVSIPMKVDFPAPVTKVISAAGGAYFSLALTDDGIYAWGGNSSGQLGNGTLTDSAIPVKVEFPASVTVVMAIAAGSYHSMAITDDGLYTWGSNGGGQLGDGTRINRTVPVKALFPLTVNAFFAMSGGGYHSLAVTDQGVFAWGNNTFGQLGTGGPDSVFPAKVLFTSKAMPSTVTAVAAGFWHSLAIGDGNSFGWGYNGNGELGDGTGANRIFPVRVVFPKKTFPVVTAIGAGSMHSLILTDQGLFASGNNSNGQLGMQGGSRYSATKVQAENNVIAIGAGYYHSLALH